MQSKVSIEHHGGVRRAISASKTKFTEMPTETDTQGRGCAMSASSAQMCFSLWDPGSPRIRIIGTDEERSAERARSTLARAMEESHMTL